MIIYLVLEVVDRSIISSRPEVIVDQICPGIRDELIKLLSDFLMTLEECDQLRELLPGREWFKLRSKDGEDICIVREKYFQFSL